GISNPPVRPGDSGHRAGSVEATASPIQPPDGRRVIAGARTRGGSSRHTRRANTHGYLCGQALLTAKNWALLAHGGVARGGAIGAAGAQVLVSLACGRSAAGTPSP